MDWSPITIHAGKGYKALINSGATISTYNKIEDCYKTPIQPTTAKLNTTDGSPMSALGMTALHLRIAEFKFIHNFIICNQLPDMGHRYTKKFSIFYAWDKEKNCYIQKEGKFLTYTRNCEQKATIGIVNSTLKIPPRHNGIIPIKISEPIMEEKWHISSWMTKLQWEETYTSKSLMASTKSTEKYITFNKGEYVGHLEPTLTDDTTIDQMEAHPPNSVMLQKMMAEQVKPDIFNPLCHKLKTDTQNKLDTLLKEYKSQFTKDETSIGTTSLTSMMINTGNSDLYLKNLIPLI